MSDKFTIKFKGILDHAATKKAIEQDITKMEKYLKPKKSSLGSTKDIVKNNLSDKKKELSRQSKFENLRERVEKYRLTQTKKLMKQGMGFEKARKEAFKRSLMSDRDKRRLGYKELVKESKAKSKMLAASQGKRLVAKIAIGSALGNIISNAISKIGGGILGFAKKAVEETSKTNKKKLLNSAFYTGKERDMLIKGTEKEKGIFSGLKGFERNLEKEEFLNQASVFKGTLRDLGKLNFHNLKKSMEFAAVLKSSGAMSSEDAVKAVNSLLSGDGSELYDILKNTWGEEIANKYTEDAKKAWQSGAEVDLESRISKMLEMLGDYKSYGLTKKADTKEEIDSNLASAEQTLSNLTTNVLEPILDLVKKITEYLKGFTFQTHVIEPFFKGLKSLFANIPVIKNFFKDPETIPNPPNSGPKRKENEDNNNNTP
ncbi:conserved hypothetical protein (plasmid) [Borreliella finlandensis]|uniref:Uncharacterized protein n=1 Tax=Borreliella finlandensis TaxID=498741 RepID=A0A826H128_9SPIR|nr:DUF759 family protein [Borreliella finlandensis]ACN93242.1 conserved hypothetical protein [Borreliella finlandensis]ACN93322.1 conserved hypothetical protein [Borreliella finlandensis]ACN93464.1 conserved hypothetical protein [Borreliella finlandensis]EEH00313.1 conserved hypothetical protein [Borreliella finlandensis]